MKTSIIAIAIFLGAVSATAQSVVQLTLAQDKPTTVSVSDQHTTTILFPDKVSAIIGNELTDGKDGNKEAAFQFSHPPGSKIVALTARSESRRGSLVALIRDRLYLIELRHNASPHLAVTLTFPSSKKSLPKEVPVRRAIELPPLNFSPPNLLRLLELARSHRLPTSTIPRRTVDYRRTEGRLTTIVEKVTRFDSEDAIVVRGTIWNHRAFKRAKIQPSRFRLRVGETEYPVSMAQAPTLIPRLGHVRFTAILMGDGKERAQIPIDREFRLVIPPSK